jgi:hypothetical protein
LQSPRTFCNKAFGYLSSLSTCIQTQNHIPMKLQSLLDTSNPHCYEYTADNFKLEILGGYIIPLPLKMSPNKIYDCGTAAGIIG